MNIKLVFNLLGKLLVLEAMLLIPALAVSLIYAEGDHMAFVYSMLIMLAAGLPLAYFTRRREGQMHIREGLATAGLSWLMLSVFGGLPLFFSGCADFIDAFFEITSGFTTTGATIMTNVEILPKGIQFWRSFTHWIGGMGILVFTTALLPSIGGRGAYLARAESPGPTFSKLTPKLGDTAKVLYLLYLALTVVELVALLIAGIPFFDALTIAFGTAGTGGFAITNLSIGHYNMVSVEIIVAIFMFLFGVNFAIYFKLITRDFKSIFKSVELRTYVLITFFSILVLSLNLISHYGDFFTSLRYASFQVPTIMSTTGFATTDFNLWPTFSKMYLCALMLFGACAGSTAGGLKTVRLVMLAKLAAREIRRTLHPRKVEVVKLDGKSVPEETLSQVAILFFCHVLIILASTLLISLENVSTTTAFTAALTCVSNVGPGLDMIGPMGNFSTFSAPIKILLAFLMLAGRLELYPILILFSRAAWRKN